MGWQAGETPAGQHVQDKTEGNMMGLIACKLLEFCVFEKELPNFKLVQKMPQHA